MRKLGIKPARLHGSSYDLPFRGLPRELRDQIYRYALCVPKLKQNYSASRYSIVPSYFEGDIGCRACYNHGPVYFPYQCPCRVCSYIPSGLEFLSVNRQMFSEAASILYGENTFYFSSCCDNQLLGFAQALPPASHIALRHIELDVSCLFARSFTQLKVFIKTLQTRFRLDTLTLPVSIDRGEWRRYPRYHLLDVRGCLDVAYYTFEALDEYLHSGRIRALRWVWRKVAFDNDSPADNIPVSETHMALVSLLNYRAAEYMIFEGIECLQWLQETLDRPGKHFNHRGFVLKTSAKWENGSVLRMWSKEAGDSDQRTLDAVRRIQDIKVNYFPDSLPE